MAPIRLFWVFLLSPSASGLASLYLAYEGLIDEQKRSSAGIIAAVAFVVANGIINFIVERSLKRKLTRINLQVNQRLNSLIGSLGQISADGYHYWKVDLYIAHWRLRWASRWPWVLREVLIRRASVSIVSTMSIHDNRELLENGPIGLCFAQQSQQIWLSPSLGIAKELTDAYPDSPRTINLQLEGECGLMRAVPIMNHLDTECIGVLVVHVEPQYGLRLSGTITSDACAQSLRAAAKDLHQMVCGL
jgi:hypothetical protein